MATILIIAERPLDRTLLTAVLQTAGHETVEASDGYEALDALAQIRPNVVISDIVMPTLDRREFVQRMRATPRSRQHPSSFPPRRTTNVKRAHWRISAAPMAS